MIILPTSCMQCYRLFSECLDWEVREYGGTKSILSMRCAPYYLLLRGCVGFVEGCVRLLPSTGPTILRDTFSVLLGGKTAPENPSV
ncbi:acyl-homoserine-lactone synthase [Mesorhizobium sp.]|uniref:acyl-homoserine-lactone synthase n=1 Tax=Mesorhizobium sp. TaxID=1871066 RepID=UPI0032AECCCE